MSEAYKNAGVDIAAGNEAVERMKKHVKRTYRPEVMTDLGGFGPSVLSSTSPLSPTWMIR